jgi:hypothetical protein
VRGIVRGQIQGARTPSRWCRQCLNGGKPNDERLGVAVVKRAVLCARARVCAQIEGLATLKHTLHVACARRRLVANLSQVCARKSAHGALHIAPSNRIYLSFQAKALRPNHPSDSALSHCATKRHVPSMCGPAQAEVDTLMADVQTDASWSGAANYATKILNCLVGSEESETLTLLQDDWQVPKIPGKATSDATVCHVVMLATTTVDNG